MSSSHLYSSHHREEGSLELARVWRSAIRALYYELATSPKPGLVTLSSNGSHHDMDASTFFRSLFSQRNYYSSICHAGAQGADFSELQQLGRAAEQRMLLATEGTNTHRGALFSLGLLSAAAGHLLANNHLLTSTSVVNLVRDAWGDDIRRSLVDAPSSPGLSVLRRYGAGGARAEAASGFPTIRDHVLPAFRSALSAGVPHSAAAVQALFTAMAILEDTNLLHRGGPVGLEFARTCAAAFLARGGVLQPNWQAEAMRIAAAFVARRLSPGGSADALAITLFLWQLEHGEEQPIWA